MSIPNPQLPTVVSLYGSSALSSIDWKPYVREPSSIGIGDVQVGLSFYSHSSSFPASKRDLFRSMRDALKRPHRDAWFRLEGEVWHIDCDRLRQSYPELRDNPNFNWLSGHLASEPDYNIEDEVDDGEMSYSRELAIEITPETLKAHTSRTAHPIEITESLAQFRQDHPDPSKVAFIMMKFGRTRAHARITKAVRDTLNGVGIAAVRADEKEYHPQLFNNIQTYTHGCRIGIAIFERLESNEFNPNVSLELGYMMALGKEVCLLKDSTQSSLPTDLVGSLYRTFDPQSPDRDIRTELLRWLKDKSLI
jgi:hypothetical protein